MKIFKIVALLLLGMALPATATPIILNVGDTYSYQFNDLPGTGTFYGYPASRQGWLFWSAKALSPGSVLQVKMFENSIDEDPLHSYIWSSDDNLGGGFTLREPQFKNVWQDLQGAFSMTVLAGSAAIETISISVLTPDFDGSEKGRTYGLRLSMVPEPASWILFLIIATAFLMHRWLNEVNFKQGSNAPKGMLNGIASD
ncbi:PEP-CTERM sorting domain-containing protein [Cellvibrio mixtus]|uniref:PEP-CTERM sorting domain-containing protein n=1 Tax=Cellvibrio mixtus TaxID=39650 RepID=UPI000587B81B|nr:PEP-CTERM sorting domain-containing protein [Cellvibrio mixtus]